MMVKAFQAITLLLGIVSVLAIAALSIAYDWLGSPSPDFASGRTYPVTLHGKIYAYVSPLLGEMRIAAFWTGVACFVVWGIAEVAKRIDRPNPK